MRVNLSTFERSVEARPKVQGSRSPVLLIPQAIRAPLSQLLARVAPQLTVLSHNEVPPDTRIVADGLVEFADAH